MMKSTLNRMLKPWTREALGTKRNPGLAGWFIPNISKAKGIWVCMHAYGLAEHAETQAILRGDHEELCDLFSSLEK